MNTFITRHPFDPEESLESNSVPKQRLMTGTENQSIVIDATSSGLVFNGFFTETNGRKYSILREPVRIRWEELDKIKEEVQSRGDKKRSKKKASADFYDSPSKEYLESLPKVTINGVLYYIDGNLKQRRPAEKPNAVYNYGEIV